jgi:hypothetical protein
MDVLRRESVPFLVGGAYAMFHYSGISRHTKDLDLFLRPSDEARARRVLLAAGYRTELVDPIWLSKALWGDVLVDLIFSSGNGVAVVDDEWLSHAHAGEVLGRRTLVVPPEEMIWSKAFVQERERFDGADVAHLVRACGRDMDWARLVARFGVHWPVLLSHLVLFAYAYPGDRDAVPGAVWRALLARAAALEPERGAEARLCRGTLLSRRQYDVDTGLWGYDDAREQDVPGWRAPTAVPGGVDALARGG